MTMDLFKDTHRSQMPLTSDYVFRTAFGRDRDDSHREACLLSEVCQ